MRKILVPTDFSDNAFKAIAYAAEIARAKKGIIHLLHVIEPSLNMATMQTDSQNRKVVKNRSDRLQRTLKAARAVYPDIRIIPWLAGGKVVDSILTYAREKKVNLVVMGTKGAGGLKKFFVGTVTAEVVSKSPVPVLTVPVSYQVQQPEKILFATNQFEKSKRILNKITAIPKLFNSEIHVVVFKQTDGSEHADLIYNQEQLDDYLRFLREAFPALIFQGALLKGDNFEFATDSYCNEHGGDMMVMVTYPKSFFERIFQQSETKQMVFHSTRPILAIPAVVNE